MWNVGEKDEWGEDANGTVDSASTGWFCELSRCSLAL